MMTEEEWERIREFDDAYSWLEQTPHLNDRKLRLLTCACFRARPSHIPDPIAWTVIEQSELYADDPHRGDEFREIVNQLSVWEFSIGSETPNELVFRAAAVGTASYRDSAKRYHSAIVGLCHLCTRRKGPFQFVWQSGEVYWQEQFVFLYLLRDIFGNPIRPVAFDPAWRTSTVIGLALTMYDSRNFNAMPILADALQDAGCENEHILTHCRDEQQVHVRGCWVVDLVLGNS